MCVCLPHCVRLVYTQPDHQHCRLQPARQNLRKRCTESGYDMTDENNQPENDDDESGIDLQGLGKRLRMDRRTARSVVEYIGPHLLWIIAAIAWGIFITSTFYAWSLIQ